MCRNVVHQAIVRLLRIDLTLGNAKQNLVQGIRRYKRALPPTATRDVQNGPCADRGGLRVTVRNPETLRKQNIDDASCVRWVLRNITEHEAIDSAIHLAGNIRWFHCGSDLDPPSDLIVSAFEGCFDSTGESYPGTKDRTYFSGRAILGAIVGARLQCRERASKYTIPDGDEARDLPPCCTRSVGGGGDGALMRTE